MTRKESEERQEAVLRYFLENPRATGEEAQRLLTIGRLLPHRGKEQPPMGLGMLYRVKRKAEDMARKGFRPEAQAPRLILDGKPDDAQMQALRQRAQELQDALSKMPDGVLEVRVSRNGVSVVRMQPTEEAI